MDDCCSNCLCMQDLQVYRATSRPRSGSDGEDTKLARKFRATPERDSAGPNRSQKLSTRVWRKNITSGSEQLPDYPRLRPTRRLQSILWADRLNVMMVTVDAQSEAQDGSFARLAINNGVIARRFCGGQFDFKERDAVGLDAAHPQSGTIRVKLVHVEKRVHSCLPRAQP